MQVHQSIAIHGFLLEDLMSSNPNWMVFSGLNDLIRDREVSRFFNPSMELFPNLSETTNMLSLSSERSKKQEFLMQIRVPITATKLVLTFHSGQFRNSFSASVSASLRKAKSGYFYGTPYDAKAFGLLLNRRKKTNKSQLFFWLNFQDRARTSSLTNEVLTLKIERYNPNWGWLNNRQYPSKFIVKHTKGSVFVPPVEMEKKTLNQLFFTVTQITKQFSELQKCPKPKSGLL